MAKWIVAEKVKARIRHAVVCSNVTGRTKERIAQSKQARADSLALVTSHKWRELVSSGRLVSRCHDVFHWCYVCFVLLRFRLFYAFVEAAALRSMVLRYSGALIATRVSLFFPFVYLEMSLFPSIFCTISAFFLYREYVACSFLPNGVFQPCDHRLDFLFLTSSAYYVRIQSINQNTKISYVS